jgi:Cu+-exporting ATPase
MNLNMFTLIALGVVVAWGYSVTATLASGLFPPTMRDAHGNVGLYFEAAAVIVALVLVGQVLELRAQPHRRRHPRPPRARAEERAAPARRRRG